jgi:hypothetical protein
MYSWLTVAVFFLTLVALGVLGGFFLAGRKVPGSVLYGTALAPFFVGVAGAAMNHRYVLSALAGEAIDPGQKARILAEGASEAESTIVLGATMTAVAMLLVGLASLFRLLSLDAATIDPARTRRAGVPMGVTAGVLGFAFVAAFATRVLLHEFGFPLSLLVFAGSVGVGVLAAWRAPLAGLVDREDADIVRTLGVLAVATTSSVIFASLVTYALAKSTGLGAISGESVDASQKARILADALEGMHAARVLGLVDGGLLLLGFSVPAIFAWRASAARGSGFRPRASLAAWAVMILLVAGAGAAQARSTKKSGVAFQRPDPTLAVAGLEVPTTRESWDDAPSLLTFYVPRDGKLLVDLSPEGNAPPAPASDATIAKVVAASSSRRSYDESTRSKLALVVDRNVTYAALKAALAPLLPLEKQFSLSVAPELRPDRKQLGELAYFIGPDAKEATLRFYTRPVPLAADAPVLRASIPNVEPSITIVTDGPVATVFSRRLTGGFAIPMTADATAVAARRSAFEKLADEGELTEIGIAPKDDDTLQTIWQLADEARSGMRRSPRIVLTSDRRTAEQREAESERPRGFGNGIGLGHLAGTGSGTGTSSAGSLRMGAVQVNGRLPPEVISRIVRQNSGRFRLCYDNGLRTDPNHQGRVAVKFVIDRSGAVASAGDGGSDLPNAGVVSCVVRAFSNLSFPEPEGGIVTVVYPIIFTAAK